MPFCPSILDEASSQYLVDDYFAPFMILCCSIRPEYADDPDLAHIVHVDQTVRPQIVYRDIDPRYWSILKRIHDTTGIGVILNTSFNNHAEPIVMTPEDALASFTKAGGKYLAMENFLVENPSSENF
jgi:carbamoyltransferase